MELSAYEIAVIGGGFGIVGTLLGSLLGYILSLQTMRIDSFNRAAAKFRDTFESERYYFTPGTTGIIYVRNILSDSEKRHFTAYNEFVLHVPRTKRRSFAEAWEKYTESREAYNSNADKDIKKAAVENIYNCINELLSFAKPK